MTYRRAAAAIAMTLMGITLLASAGQIRIDARSFYPRTAADGGEIDGDYVRVAGLEAHYPNLGMVEEPISSLRFCVFKKKGATVPGTWEGLRATPMGIIIGWKILEERTKGFSAVGAKQVFAADPPLDTKNMYLHLNMRHKSLATSPTTVLRAMRRDGTILRLTTEAFRAQTT
jgi:polar amino acid transport system substrate-binding protein